MSMINSVSARDVIRDFKGVTGKVQESKKPVIVYSHSRPIMAMVNLDLWENLNLEIVKLMAIVESKHGLTTKIDNQRDLEEHIADVNRYVNED